jgi:hypothetical protein
MTVVKAALNFVSMWCRADHIVFGVDTPAQLIQNIDIIIFKYTRTELQNNNIFESPISSLYGYHKSMNFESKGYSTIGDLYLIFKNNEYDNIKFEEYLKNKLNIYSNFYMKNIIKNINMIHYLS